MARMCGVWVLATVAGLWSASASAENWPGWRGPRGDGTSQESAPTHWSATENIAWKVEIPGRGHSSPVVWEDRIFLVSCDEAKQERLLLCLDRKSGKTIWQRVVLKSPLEGKHDLNSFASSTPATDGRLVYVTFLATDGRDSSRGAPGEMVVAAYDFDGNQRWLVRPGPFSSVHGYSSCPVLFEDKVIVNGDHDGEAYLVALDRATGHTVWKIPRGNNTRSYSTPVIRQLAGRTQMILSGNKCVASYDPHDGSRHWIVDGPTEQFVASVVDDGKLIFLTAGFPEHHILAIRPDGTGNVTRSHIVWRTSHACAYVPSPIVANGYLLVVSDGGVASCFEPATGKVHWRKRLGTHFSASPVYAGGLVHFLEDDGVMRLVRPGPTFEVVAENSLGEECYASPTVSQGQLFIRGVQHLYAIGTAKE